MTKASPEIMLEKLDGHMENHWSIETGEVVTISLSGRYKYVFTPPQYAALAEAISMNPPENVFWQSSITEDMVSDLTELERSHLEDDLNDATFNTCYEYGVN